MNCPKFFIFALIYASSALAQGIFVPTGDLRTARYDHSATLLPNGLVLVVGGVGGPPWIKLGLASGELYDPQTFTFTDISSMEVFRAGHTATLLNDGRVLLVGGYQPSGSTNTAELFDADTLNFRLTGSMLLARSGHTATLLRNGGVLVVGGNFGEAEVFNPYTEEFTASAALQVDRGLHTATLLPTGKVLIAGGTDGMSSVASAELFDDEEITCPKGTHG